MQTDEEDEYVAELVKFILHFGQVGAEEIPSNDRSILKCPVNPPRELSSLISIPSRTQKTSPDFWRKPFFLNGRLLRLEKPSILSIKRGPLDTAWGFGNLGYRTYGDGG
ncbi:hypothetical protein TWF102_006206 [Orbilia oligospora]|uniref:Uncharacterized protein n=1 Tax=Orbilia oligospora TaxID=2813651 RepID=A0A7C8JEQ1_ORBOL|nr:hypothetical protein TWF102_006206 [Orbilia oligospora]